MKNQKNKTFLFLLLALLLIFLFDYFFLSQNKLGPGESKTIVEETTDTFEIKSNIDEMPYVENIIENNDAEYIKTESKESKEMQMSADRTTYQNGFYYEPLSENVKNRITGSSYPKDDSNSAIQYDDLRYVSVQYYNFNQNIKTGELICHKDIAQDLLEIFYELYLAQYPIEKIRLVDEYNADDDLSMKDNNTSCFNYRFVQNTTRLSNHSYGRAIDINPFFNPYVSTNQDGSLHVSPEESTYYADRSKEFSYKITEDDLVCRLFKQHGFTWGGDWNSIKDYQHFEKE